MVMSGQVFESWTACLRSFSALIRISAAFLRSASKEQHDNSFRRRIILADGSVARNGALHSASARSHALGNRRVARKSAIRHDHPMKPATPDACCCRRRTYRPRRHRPPGAADRERGTRSRRSRAPVPLGQRPCTGCRTMPIDCWPGCEVPAPHPAQGRRGGRHLQPRHRRLRAGGCADRGRQNPRHPAQRRTFERRRSGDRRHQSHRGAGLHRHASPFLPGSAAEHPHQRPAQSRLQSRHRQYAHTGLCARDTYAGVSSRRSA